jgi:hypothetical protein
MTLAGRPAQEAQHGAHGDTDDFATQVVIARETVAQRVRQRQHPLPHLVADERSPGTGREQRTFTLVVAEVALEELAERRVAGSPREGGGEHAHPPRLVPHLGGAAGWFRAQSFKILSSAQSLVHFVITTLSGPAARSPDADPG